MAANKYNAYITPSGFSVRKNTTAIATFGSSITLGSDGATVTIGKTGTNSTYNTVINSSGLTVNDNTTPVAQFGATTTIGKLAQSHVEIAPTSISMQTKATSSSSPITTFELIQTSTTVKVVKVYNKVFTDLNETYIDTINLGRTVSSWSSIKLRYKVNNGSITTATYTSVPIDVWDNSKFCFRFTPVDDSSTIEWTVDIGGGGSATPSDKVTIIDLELNFVTGQQVIESVIGAYANKTQSGVLRIGNGTASNATSNAMFVDWAGTARFKGDVIAYCNSDSSGGMSLTEVVGTDSIFNYETSTSQVVFDVYQVGRLVTIHIWCTKSVSTASSANIFDANLKNVHIPVPISFSVTGGSYYGAHAIGFLMRPNDNDGKYHLICRNASSTAVTVTGDIYGTLTYIASDIYTDEW